MKKSDSALVRQNLRRRYLDYIQKHGSGNRVPRIVEIREALGVTNYMLMKCIKELRQEGLLVCNSRRNGIQLARNIRKRGVVGLFLDQGRSCDYFNSPTFLEGFFHVLGREPGVYIRCLHCPGPAKISGLFREFGLDNLVIVCENKFFSEVYESLSPALRSRTVFCMLDCDFPHDYPENVISEDCFSWIREYVGAAVRRNCRSFIQLVSAPGSPSIELFNEEIRRQGLEWSADRVVVGSHDLRRRIDSLRKKYHVDAVRCMSPLQPTFFSLLKDWPDFRPYMPLYGYKFLAQIVQDSPWLNAEMISEDQEDYLYRMGLFTGEKIRDAIGGDLSFSHVMFPRYFFPDAGRSGGTENLRKNKRNLKKPQLS